MKRIIAFLLVIITITTMYSFSYAEINYSYDEKTGIFSILDYRFIIPADFDGHSFNMIDDHIPMFYPKRLDAQTSLIFIVNAAESYTENDLVKSLNSMKNYLMSRYKLTNCMSEEVIDFLDTKALSYCFSSKEFSEFYAAVSIDKNSNTMLIILQFTDSTDTSDIQYENNFQSLLSSAIYDAKKGIKGIDYSLMAKNATSIYRTSSPNRISDDWYSTYGRPNAHGITIYYDIVINGNEMYALQFSGFPDSDLNASFLPIIGLIKDIKWNNFSADEYDEFITKLEAEANNIEKNENSNYEGYICGLYVHISKAKYEKYILSIEIAAVGYENEF